MSDLLREAVVVLECNIDDMTGEELAYARDHLLEAGALDAWCTPTVMKKGRPAVVLSVLCRPAEADGLVRRVLRETTTLGVRWRDMDRIVAERRIVVRDTSLGTVRLKLKVLDGHVVSLKPEHDDCSALAKKHGLSIRGITDRVMAECRDLLGMRVVGASSDHPLDERGDDQAG